MANDKTFLKIIPFVKIVLICEPVFEVERCSPLDRSCPQFHRVRYCSVVCECNEEATVMESPEVEYSLEVKRIPDNKSPVDHLESTDGDDLFDDVIEIKPSIPLIDLTEEQCGIEKPDLAEDLLGLLGTSDKSLENITIYRSDETSNSSLEVQAMSASFTPRVLGTTMPKKVEAKVEPNESNQMIVIELNPNISTDEKKSTESQAGTQQMEVLANGMDALNGSVTVNRPETENANALESSELIPENMSSESNNSLFTTSVVNRTTGSSDATDSTGSISSNDMPNADIPATSQIPENIENDSNSLTRLTRFVHSSGSQANIPLNRSNGAELIQPSAYNRTNAISQSSRMNTGNLDLAFGSEVNSETVIPDFQSTVTVLANGRVPNLSQQEYSVAAVITQYMNLMIFIRRNQSIYEQSLMQATIQPELQQLEVKLSKQMYIEKLQKYSTFIIFHLKTLCLSGNMTAVTADATVDFISRNVCKVNPCVTKLAVILYLERLLEPQKQFYTSIPYLASFYNHVQFLCTQIRRRVPPSGPIPGTSICREQLAPDQMKVLQYQIQQYLQIVDIERSRHTNAASKNPNSQEIDLRNGYLYQTLNSPTKQKSGNERSERTSKSKINGSKTSQVVMDNFKNPAPISDLPNVNRRRSPLNHHQTSNSAYNPSAALQSPSHRPEVFVNASHVSPVAVRNQTHSIISSSSANLSTTLRSPTHMPEGIHPPVYSTFHNQSQLNNPHMSPARNSILQKSPAHIPEGLQTQALSSVSNLRQMNNLPFMSPAQTPVRSAPNQNQTNYISFMSSAHPTPIMRSPAHRPEGIQLQACSMPTKENMTAMSPVHQPRRNPAHRQEGIQPQPYLSPSQSRPNNMLCMSPAQPYNSKSPVHRPEGNQMQAYSCNSPQSQINTVSYMSPARPSITTKSSANRPLGMQPPVNPSIVPNQSGLTNFVFTHPAHSTTLRSPAHKPDSIVKSPRRVESNQSQMSRISQNSALHPMASIQTDVPSIVQSASNDKVTHSPGHLSAVQLSPAHRTEGRRLGFKLPKNSLITGGSSNSPPVTEQLVRMSPSHVMNRNSPVMDQNSPVMYQNSPVPASANHQSISPTNTLSNASMDTSPREAAAIQSSSSEIPSATPCQTMPNLINIRSPVYAPMLFSPENFPQDGSEGESAQNNAEEESCSDDAIETIDLTWLDEVDEEQIQNEINFIAVKKEEPEDGEVILNQEQFPVEECSELVYTDRLCICEKPAEYLCRCRMAMYCSSSCQTRDWKDHRSICIRYVAKK
ncbi:hypothetical protein JTB14_016523 [Gonioctena quinquepunctata]|nr:hypothetical protein JTB14_016523 [Gonioctena quinquepunctata]